MLYNIPKNCHCLINKPYPDLKLYLVAFQYLDEGSHLGGLGGDTICKSLKKSHGLQKDLNQCH